MFYNEETDHREVISKPQLELQPIQVLKVIR